MNIFTIGSIKKVRALNGWLWINEGVRYVVQAKYAWMTTLFLFVISTMFLVLISPFLQVLLIFVFPFVTAGLSLACSDIEKGHSISVEYLFKAFSHPNKANIFRYGLLLMLMMLIFQLVVSIILTSMGISQEQLTSEMTKLAENEQASISYVMLSPVLSVYFVLTLLGLLPILVLNMLSPVLLAFSHLSAHEAIKLSAIAGLRNLSAFIIYGLLFVLAIIIVVTLLKGLSLLLIGLLGDESTIASMIYMMCFLSMILGLASISYSSAYVAFKDIFLEDRI